jgi:hypothetical protein
MSQAQFTRKSGPREPYKSVNLANPLPQGRAAWSHGNVSAQELCKWGGNVAAIRVSFAR